MRQAVIVFHGMGEQVPMTTVRSFVESVWRKDDSSIDRDRPDAITGGTRTENAAWTRPDERTGSFEIRRITTEKGDNEYYTDFFEFYWAHLVHGTTLDQVTAWIKDLLFRRWHRVPSGVKGAWIILWLLTLVLVSIGIWSVLPKEEFTGSYSAYISVGMAVLSLVSTWLVSNILIKRFGDVVRYVKADPPNIDRRQQIREEGVRFLKRILGEKRKTVVDGQEVERPVFDRVIVVAHSLGTIVAYDVLNEAFAQICEGFDDDANDGLRHPKRAQLESEIRQRLKLEPSATGTPELTVERFQKLQDAARAELIDFGTPWRVSNFVTLGSPLTHAEFLMADDLNDLRAQQRERGLATCPPMLEFDRRTEKHHFTFRRGSISKVGKLTQEEKTEVENTEPLLPRRPHHAALFAYTPWTNIFSQHRALLTGDIISGPLSHAFGLHMGGATPFSGIADIAVMPDLDSLTAKPAKNHRRRLFSHNSYWSMTGGTDLKEEIDPETKQKLPPHHIRILREAIRLKRP